tara:strand:- start:202 stop:492 length:291 start_codon:yes stop_codon:yes gene_type:complete
VLAGVLALQPGHDDDNGDRLIQDICGRGFENSKVTCFVADNGVGVDERFREKIFGLCQTLGGEGAGKGVGPALAKKIVDLHGDDLWVESAGHGDGS